MLLVGSGGALGQDAPQTSGKSEALILQEAGVLFTEALQSLEARNRVAAIGKFNSLSLKFFEPLAGPETKQLSDCRDAVSKTTVQMVDLWDGTTDLAALIATTGSTCGWTVEQKSVDSAVSFVKETAESQSEQAAADEKENNAAEEEYLRSLLPPAEGEEAITSEQLRDLKEINGAAGSGSLGFSFQSHPMILQFIGYYQGRGRATMASGLQRSGLYMRMARRIFREEGVPEQVAWLAQVESAWKPHALSWASASGLWQFIPGTGQRFGLRRTAYVDERNSFEKATRASARYLKFLHNRFQNWELALAAYNTGEGNVDRAIARAGVRNFWAAYPYLARETRNYVPSILATIIIANNPAKYGFGNVRPEAPLQWDSVRVPALTDLSFVAESAGTTVAALRFLNPELRSNTTPPESYIVRVPKGNGGKVVAAFRNRPAAVRGEAKLEGGAPTWESISRQTGVSVERLKAANPGMKVPRGTVYYPVAGNVEKTGSVTKKPTAPTASPASKSKSAAKPAPKPAAKR